MIDADVSLHSGNCLDVLKDIPDNSVDTIITDPPYGLKFMNNKWDYETPDVNVWAECLRVAKPGSILLSFGGTRTYHRITTGIENAGWEIRDCIMWLHGNGFPKGLDIGSSTGKQEWTGYRTALKPAYEPILIAQKPIAGTYTNNALTWGVAGFNVDECRIPTDDKWKARINPDAPIGAIYSAGLHKQSSPSHELGRFPTNVILDEEATELLDAHIPNVSRFFYCAKASSKERNHGLDTPNIHQTVKPLKLMEYLCTLTKTPTGGIVIDPYMGSGSTGIAAIRTGRKFVGIELDTQYLDIAHKRIMAEIEEIRSHIKGGEDNAKTT